MDRTRGHHSCQFCPLVRRSEMGFYCKSFRFEGGGRNMIGLNRTGKSCRLRWVNYLNPGLKRGKMTPQEERLVLQLHAKWGNRWSKIARKLPGRTDNEIKNYWRTYTRKKAQQIKQGMPSPSSSSSHCCSSSISTTTMFDAMHSPDSGKASFDDTGGSDINVMNEKQKEQEAEECQEGYSMDDIWKEIDLSEENTIKPVNDFYLQEGSCFYCPVTASSEWEHSTSIWRMDADETEISPPLCHYTACSKHGVASFIG